MTNLADLCEDFKSTGIPSLIKNCPDISEILVELQESYDGEGELLSIYASHVFLLTMTSNFAELLPVDGKDDEYEVGSNAI